MEAVHVAYLFLAGALLHRLYLYRLIRPYLPVIVLAFLVYRYTHRAENGGETILSLSLSLLNSLFRTHCPCLSFLLGDLLGLLLLSHLLSLIHQATNWNIRGLFRALTDWGFSLVKDFSPVKKTLDGEREKLESSFDKDLKLKGRALGLVNNELPEKAMGKEEILSLIKGATAKEDVIWEKGHLSGAVYNGQRHHIDFLNQVIPHTSSTPPLPLPLTPPLPPLLLLLSGVLALLHLQSSSPGCLAIGHEIRIRSHRYGCFTR